MRKVFVRKCSGYNEKELEGIFEDIIDNTDSIKKLRKGSIVLLKTNLIIRKKPEAAATTHPLFLRALAKTLLKRDLKVIVGDSPGGLFHKTFLKSIYDICGLTKAFEDIDAELNYNTQTVTVQNPNGKKLKELSITKYIQDVDYIINVPKLKTHVPMMLAGAIKNFYGIIAGEKKFDYHFVHGENKDFANVLIDIYEFKKPDLTIMDAIIGMDHNGPTSGEPIDIKLVLAGEDGYSLDLTAIKIIKMDPVTVPVIRAAVERNLIKIDEKIEIIGEKLQDVILDNFTLPYIVHHPDPPKIISILFGKLLESIKPKVIFDYNICKSCKECVKICPAKAIEFIEGKPKIKYKKCIKCFCCHELCTVNAIKIKQSQVLKTILNVALHNNRLQKTLEGMFGMLGAGAQERDTQTQSN